MQISMQERLHEHLEAQRKLQAAIESHGKYLQRVIEEQREGNRSRGDAGEEEEPGGGGTQAPAVAVTHTHGRREGADDRRGDAGGEPNPN